MTLFSYIATLIEAGVKHQWREATVDYSCQIQGKFNYQFQFTAEWV